MNIGRAKEILDSPEIIPVTYQGEPIIIQNVDDKTGMARVFMKNRPEEEKDIPVTSLIEE